MPGFVDVSNMSDQQIKRMGQMDDDIDYQPRQKTARPAQVAHKFPVNDVWAAACAAQRINGEYVKEAQYRFDENTGQTILVKHRNRDVMQEFLHNPDRLLVEDVEEGERVRNFLQNDLTFRAIKGRLTEFDSAVSKALVVQDCFDVQRNKYELAVVASLPASAARAQKQQNSDQRIQFSKGGLIGKVGDKVSTQVEVVSSVYSKTYGIYWIKGVTDLDQPVFFSAKEAYNTGTWLTVKGAVKAHRDNMTQLTRVKVL